MDTSHRQLRTVAIGLRRAGMAVAGCSGSTKPDANAKSVDGWSRAYAGTTLNVIAGATANSTILEGLLPDFDEKTGIKVRLEQAPCDSCGAAIRTCWCRYVAGGSLICGQRPRTCGDYLGWNWSHSVQTNVHQVTTSVGILAGCPECVGREPARGKARKRMAEGRRDQCRAQPIVRRPTR